MASTAAPTTRAPAEELSIDEEITADGNGSNEGRVRFASGLRRRILHFTPSWFVVNMGTGISSILLYNLPYSFNGLKEIAIAIWLLNVVLFSLFLLIARYCIFPTVLSAMLYHPVQSLFLGCFPMGFATIVNMTVFVAAERWGGRWIWLAWSLWWVDAAISVIIAIGVPFFVFTRHQHASTLNTVSPAWLLPIVAPNVASATGGIVAAVLPPSQARLTIVVSYMLWSSVPVAVMIMGLLYLRMAVHKIPLATEIFSVLLPLGACGQGAFAILQLAEVSLEHTKATGVWLDGGRMLGNLPAGTAELVASAVWAGTVCIALVIWALG
ncbi:sulfite efflux pump SSU1, partial [Rhodotorula toruloides NP11]